MTRKRLRRWILLLIAALLMVVALGVLLAPHVLRSYLVRWSGMQRLAPYVYIDPDMSESRQELFLAVLVNARGRVEGLYGEMTAHPTIIAGHSMDVMAVYGGNTYNRAGKTLSSAAATFIILGPQGVRDVNILAHELAHAEFFARIGYLNRSSVPNWFDEGLAVQVDERISLDSWRLGTDNGRTAPELSQMGVIRHDDWLGYATAKYEVRRWLDLVGLQGLLHLIESINHGAEFYQIYRSIEEAHTSAQ
jgi:hypothetical protein